MSITYKINIFPETDAVISLYKSAGLPRPVEDAARIAKMYEHANLVISAWDGNKLVGIARSLTDFSFCCYLSDLAVHEEYKKWGIGKKLVALSKEQAGDESMLLLLSVPGAMEYYPRIGMTAINNAFLISRTV